MTHTRSPKGKKKVNFLLCHSKSPIFLEPILTTTKASVVVFSDTGSVPLGLFFGKF